MSCATLQLHFHVVPSFFLPYVIASASAVTALVVCQEEQQATRGRLSSVLYFLRVSRRLAEWHFVGVAAGNLSDLAPAYQLALSIVCEDFPASLECANGLAAADVPSLAEPPNAGGYIDEVSR